MKTLGDRIAGLRGLKSRDEFGVSYAAHRHTVAKWETDAVRPDDAILYKMSMDYGVPLDWLLHGFRTVDAEEDKTPSIDSTEKPEKAAGCPRCFELYEKLVRAMERENALLKENAALQAKMQELPERLSLCADADDKKTQISTA